MGRGQVILARASIRRRKNRILLWGVIHFELNYPRERHRAMRKGNTFSLSPLRTRIDKTGVDPSEKRLNLSFRDWAARPYPYER